MVLISRLFLDLGAPQKANFTYIEYALERDLSLCIKAAPLIALAS